jgi:hypothetical protein
MIFEESERKGERSIGGGDEDLEGSHGDAWREMFEDGADTRHVFLISVQSRFRAQRVQHPYSRAVDCTERTVEGWAAD